MIIVSIQRREWNLLIGIIVRPWWESSIASAVDNREKCQKTIAQKEKRKTRLQHVSRCSYDVEMKISTRWVHGVMHGPPYTTAHVVVTSLSHIDPFPGICRLTLFFWGVSSSSSCAGLMAISFVSLMTINYSLFIHAILAGWFGWCRLPFILYRWFERERETFPSEHFVVQIQDPTKNNSEHKKKFYRTPKKEEEGSDDHFFLNSLLVSISTCTSTLTKSVR